MYLVHSVFVSDEADFCEVFVKQTALTWTTHL